MKTNEASQGGELALVHAATAGDESAWSALVERFLPLVWEIIRAHGLGVPEAAGAVHVTWLRLAQHLGRLPEPERVGAWLEGAARQESLRALALAQLEATCSDSLRRTIG